MDRLPRLPYTYIFERVVRARWLKQINDIIRIDRCRKLPEYLREKFEFSAAVISARPDVTVLYPDSEKSCILMHFSVIE